MTKYKVGDVAALFAKPKEPTTEAGKKLQSLFEEFHSKKNKSAFKNKKTAIVNENIEKENGNSENHRDSKQGRKRKFSAVAKSDSTLSVENHVSEIVDGQEDKISNKKFKRDNNNPGTDFPRKKKKKFESKASVETRKKGNVKNKFESPDNSTKSVNSSFIKKSKHRKNKDVNAYLDKATAKDNGENFVEDDDDGDDDELVKEEIKQFLEKNSKKTKVGKNKRSNTNEDPQEKSSNFTKVSKKKSKINDSFKDSSLGENYASTNNQTLEVDLDFNKSPMVQNQMPDFIRKPKIKNKNKNNAVERCNDKNINNALNGDDTLFTSEHMESRNCGKSFVRTLNGVHNSKEISPQKMSEPDFIRIADSKSFDDKERLKRTVFVGNLPLNINRKALKALFSPFGEIENIRCVGVETDKSKIFSKNPPKSLNSNYASETAPGFVVFKEQQSAIDALKLTGTVFKGHHITVDIALPKGEKRLYDDKRSVFIGNLPFNVQDESIWNAFSECGRIEGVRIVRDRESGIAKGFGFVVFSTIQSRENALALKDLEIEGRSIRIKPVESDKARQKSKETPAKRDTFKSHAIRFKKGNKNLNSRKSVTKLVKREKTKHNKKKVAAILQKSMK